jgi:organic radical activating enzyme
MTHGYDEVYKRLNEVSPSFCSAKWQMLTLYLNTGRAHSCYHPARHNLTVAEVQADPSALHNSGHKKKMRKLMLEGHRPSECDYCWTLEDLGQLSDRAIHSQHTCNYDDIEKLSKLPWDANVNPVNVEISFSSACNLKCSYCMPEVSSKWREEIEEHGPYPTSLSFNALVSANSAEQAFLEREDNPYVEAFWKWWPDLIKDMKLLRVTGGEPLMTKHTFTLMENIANEKLDLDLAINSNLSVPDKLIDKLIHHGQKLREAQSVRRLSVFTSVDTWGEQAEYARFGLDYNKFLANVRRVLREIPDSHVSFMVTFNILSVPRFTGLLEEIKRLRDEFGQFRIGLDTPFLRHPQHQNISILAPEYASYLDHAMAYAEANLWQGHGECGFGMVEIEKIKRLRAYLTNTKPEPELSRHRSDFYKFFKEHDRRRGTDFCATFPELVDFYNDCKVIAGD